MADYNSELPIRSSLPGQVLPDDVIIKIGDGTNPTTQLASVDVHGSVQSRIADASGDVMGSQLLSATYWLQIVEPSNGPTAPGTAAAYSSLIGGQYNSTLPTLTTGQQSAIQVNANGILLTAPTPDQYPSTQSITAQDTATTSTAAFNQTWYTGTPTAGSAATFTLLSDETAMFEISGTWTGTLQCEISVDGGTTWVANSLHISASPINTAQFTGNVIGFTNIAAKTQIRIRAISAWTGTATVRINLSVNSESIYVANPIKLLDGSSSTSTVEANILAASTAASATNTSLVVALSPNTPLPSGTNALGTVNASNFPTTVDTNYGTVDSSTIRTASQIGNAAGAADFNNGATDAQTLRVAANLAVAGANVTVSNPVPVTITSASAGTPIQQYLTSANLASGASATLTYTVPAGHTFSLERIWASASGKIKVVVQNGATTIYAAFNSTANPNIDITVTAPPTIAAAGTVNVTITNEDKAAFDVYATVEGNQIT
jgi:hypothetical protein